MLLARGSRVPLTATDRCRRAHAAFQRVWRSTFDGGAGGAFETWFRDDGWPLLARASPGAVEDHLRRRFLDPIAAYAPAPPAGRAPPVTDRHGQPLRRGDLVRASATGTVWAVGDVVEVVDAHGRTRLLEGEAAMHRVRDGRPGAAALWVDDATRRVAGVAVFSAL